MRLWIAAACILLLFSFVSPGIRKFQVSGYAQGTTYHVTYYAEDSLVTKARLDSLLSQIDSSLSLYKTYSLVSRFNESSGGISVDSHFTHVVNRALEIYSETGGLFDMAIYPLTKAWGFGVSKPAALPTEQDLKEILMCTGSAHIYWEGNRLAKRRPCVQLDPNGIAQGYTVDRLAGLLEQYGIRNYLVELGGEIRIRGRRQPGQEKMSIGIEGPGDSPGLSIIEKVIYPGNGGVTSSGTYRRFYENGGRRISHLLDPRTGSPIQNELISVTVLAPDAMTADAYDNALMVMGLEKALAFVEKRSELAAYFIYRKNDGTIKDTASERFKNYLDPDN